MELLELILVEISKNTIAQKNYILRGSMLYRQRIDSKKQVKDLDLFIVPQYFDLCNLSILENLIENINNIMCKLFTIESVYHDYFHIHKIITVTLKSKEFGTIVKLDIGRDADDLMYYPFNYQLLNGDFIQLQVSPICVDLAWKIQLLLKGSWRPKDVYDANLLHRYLKNNNQFSEEFISLFWETFKNVMKYRGLLLDNTLPLITNKKFGKSRSAKQRWKKWQKNSGVYNDADAVIDTSKTFMDMSNTFMDMSNTFEEFYLWMIPIINKFE
jgi:hypothetical protein